MSTTIKLSGIGWKQRTTANEPGKHHVAVVYHHGTLVAYHSVRILTETPEAYHAGYKIIRKVGNKYLIEAQESYTVETWERISQAINSLLQSNGIENLDEEEEDR